MKIETYKKQKKEKLALRTSEAAVGVRGAIFMQWL